MIGLLLIAFWMSSILVIRPILVLLQLYSSFHRRSRSLNQCTLPLSIPFDFSTDFLFLYMFRCIQSLSLMSFSIASLDIEIALLILKLGSDILDALCWLGTSLCRPLTSLLPHSSRLCCYFVLSILMIDIFVMSNCSVGKLLLFFHNHFCHVIQLHSYQYSFIVLYPSI